MLKSIQLSVGILELIKWCIYFVMSGSINLVYVIILINMPCTLIICFHGTISLLGSGIFGKKISSDQTYFISYIGGYIVIKRNGRLDWANLFITLGYFLSRCNVLLLQDDYSQVAKLVKFDINMCLL